MSTSISRRGFLGNLTLATTGIALSSTASVVSALTEDQQVLNANNPQPNTTADMRQTLLGKQVSVKGTVFNKDGSATVPNARIEVWHLSPNSKDYGHRATFTSDANGNYKFITDVPYTTNGTISSIHFKISRRESSYVSQLWMNEHSAYIDSDHWERNQHLGELLLPKKECGYLCDEIRFNFSI